MTHNRGFTLLEMLLSLTIVATLGLVLIATTQKNQQQTQIRIATLQMNTIANAAIDYYKMYTEWPTTVTALNPLLNNDLSCSVWKNASGCTRYKITSAANSHYFALAVTTPNAAIAAHLAAQLPSAYQIGTTVTAYITTFSGFKLQAQVPPPGVLLSANSLQLNGVCNTTGYANPFTSCVSSSAAPSKPYGLIDINAQPKNSIVSQNLFAIMRGAGNIGASFTSTAAPTCAAGTMKTMIFLPVGTKTTIVTDSTFRYLSPGFNARLQATFTPFVGNGGNQPTTAKEKNVSAGVGDILCLPASAITPGWGY